MSSRVRTFLSWLTTTNGVSIALGTVALVYGLRVVSRYGVTFDSPALFYAGDRTLYWAQHGFRSELLDFMAGDDPPGFRTMFPRLPEFLDPVHYPVFPALICAVTSFVLHDALGIFDTVSGHHAGLVLLHACLLAAYCEHASKLLGKRAGIIAAVTLFLFPSAMGHSFNNAKDWPCAEAYGLAILAFGIGVLDAKPRRILLAGVWFGVALSCKINALFVLATLLPWAALAYFLFHFRDHSREFYRLTAAALVAPYLGGILFVLLWPWLYQGTLDEIWFHLNDYVVHFFLKGMGERPDWTLYPFRCVFYMTPPIVLVAASVYAIFGMRGGRREFAIWALLSLWFLVPLLRIAMPRTNFYDANRHFIEYVPALCAMAGAGADRIAALFTRHVSIRMPKRWNAATAVLASGGCLGALLFPLITYFPYEATYFNAFAGGLGGAQRDGLLALRSEYDAGSAGSEGDYWYSSLKDGLRKVHARAGDGATVAICGPWDGHAQTNVPEGSGMTVVNYSESTAGILFLVPREADCPWVVVRALESERPVLERVERDGGLIYEILGAPSGGREPVSGENWYTAEH